MITWEETPSSQGKKPKVFYANSNDIALGKHLPDANGYMVDTRVKLKNADSLMNIETGDIMFFDADNNMWKEI